MLRIGMILDNEFTGDMRVENEVASLVASGFHVVVLCITHGSKPEREVFAGAVIIRKPMSAFFKRKTKPFIGTALDVYTRRWGKWVAEFVETEKMEVLHVHDLYMLPAAFAARKSVRPDLPIVADLHENYPAALENYQWSSTFPGNKIVSIPKWRRDEITWCNTADHIITVIEEATVRYVKLGVPEEKLKVVPNYVNEDFFQLPDEEDVNRVKGRFVDKFVVSYVGGFDAHRGLEETISALPLIAPHIPDIKLVLVGDGVNRLKLEALSEALGVTELVSFEGWQAPKEIPAYLGASNICLIPHVKSEHTDNTIPHKLFQYMLLGKPVVTSDCAPLKRIVLEARVGKCYRSGDPEELARVIVELHNDPAEMEMMGERGKAGVRRTYNWDAAAVALGDMYKGISSKL